MGCGESKHAVATTESISTSSKRWKSFSRKSSKNVEAKNEEINNDATKIEGNNEKNVANNSSQEVDKEIKKDDDEKFSVNEAKSEDRSPPNTSIEEPILNENANKEEEKSGESESNQKEKEQSTENGELEKANEEEANEDATPRAEKEQNIVTAMDETAGSAEN